MLWTDRQRGAIILMTAALLLLLLVRYAQNPTYIPDPAPLYPARAAELMDRVDPNTADAATLAALPVIGPKLAERIIEERESFLRDHANEIAFAALADLRRVNGIGDATLKTLEPYLVFPESPDGPTTRP